MAIEFDSAKDEANIAKHGISLAFGVRLFEDPRHLLIRTFREIDGETRIKVVGMVDSKLYTAVHVLRGSAVRFISVRRSNDGEERAYYRA
ncbi:hypothetical protein SAMN05444678_10686 [Sphingomonas sp. YR710]|uniref:BrnT family toxin n=1 Tax=Sphingomonas sp. YR710 TaxID=1882773 RepID=UPI00088D4CD4|nr:BrnT family toxin [Sphingomonas sp. YR710]SDC84380.1 hypothetical protein SAMN05444678_10686 [Sphingomonas sp. YR710]